MSTWHARTASELGVISGVVHDAWFDPDDIHHDASARTLVVPFAQDRNRVVEDDAPERSQAPTSEVAATTWRYREERVPFVRGRLRIGNVLEVERDDAIGDAGMLLRLSYDEQESRVAVHGVSGTLEVVVDDLDVGCELSRDDIALWVRRRNCRLFGSTSEVPLWDVPPTHRTRT